ncbi:helix-turn-helix domain-containing protein [Streptomyces venezuelae]|uniref:helix-turn-helix domain-containing protein n=1 Tax=Streptomyces venezuelae TaxID=54571 RepID=UPI0033246AC3
MEEDQGPPDPLAELKARLEHLRVKSRLTRTTQLPIRAGLGRTTVSQALNGRTVPTAETVMALATALGTDAEPLLKLQKQAMRRASQACVADGTKGRPPGADAPDAAGARFESHRPHDAEQPHGQLDAYLRTVEPTLDAQPYAGVVDDGLPALSAVYLRRQIRCLDEEAHPADADRPPAVSSATIVPADDILVGTRTCVVMAGPGAGKSSLLRTWLAEGIGRCLRGEGPALPVPVLVPAQALITRGKALHGGSLPDALTRAVAREYERELPGLFATPPRDGAPWLVLVDGLDEIPRAETRQSLLRHLAVHAHGPGADLYRFVVATRPLPRGELDRLGAHVPRFDLLPFQREELAKVAHSWFTALPEIVPDPAELTKRFITELAAREQLTELARTPLIAGLLCQLYAHRREMPRARGGIYDEYAALLILQQQRRAQDASGVPDVGEVALDIAGHLAARRLAPRDEQDADAPLTDLLRSWPGAWPEGMTPKETVLRSGMLTQRAGELEFLHQTFLEYCAARHATRTPQMRAESTTRLFEDRWARHRPWKPVPAVTVFGWGQRFWTPPGEKEASYTGFLLDRLLTEPGSASQVEKKLLRLTGRRDLLGCRFLAEQSRLGTGLPESVTRAAARSLTLLARITDDDRRRAELRANPDRMHPETDPGLAEVYLSKALRNQRVIAAEALGWLDGEYAADILAELAEVPCLATGIWRVQAAVRLAGADDPRGLPLLHRLATDVRVHDEARVDAAGFMVEHGDEHGVELLHDLARDGKLRPQDRALAVSVLAGIGHERSADTLGSLAQNADTPPDVRIRSAMLLAVIGDGRGPDLLARLAADAGLPIRTRLGSAGSLAHFEPARGVDTLVSLAHDRTLRSAWRLAAVQELAGHDPERAAAVVADLGDDPTVSRRHRRRAARLLP